MRLSACLAVPVLAAMSLVARADTFSAFNVSATLDNGGTVTGTVDLDVDSGFIPGSGYVNQYGSTANLTYSLGGVFQSTFVDNDRLLAIGNNFAAITFQANTPNPGSVLSFTLILPTTTDHPFAAYSGSALCSTTNFCTSYGESTVYVSGANLRVTSGTLTPVPVSVTPEPSGLVLLGTGVVGAVGMARRRLMR